MNNIKILDKKREWDTFIASFEHSDSYHTYEYHKIVKNETEQPVLIQYCEGDRIIALPLLLRTIPGSSYMDATSVYGYPGPLTKNIGPDYDNTSFRAALLKLLYSMEVVSVFSRLNPFIPYQDIILKNMGEVAFCGKIVNIDLTMELEDQKKEYNRRLKTHINKARKNCTTKKASNDMEIDAFINLYYENMRRVNATKNYFFDRNYFFELIRSKDFNTEVLLAVHNESKEIISGAMFVKKNKIVQYHLSGTDEDYLYLNPVKMLIDEMRVLATQENFGFYNLGGGVGSSEDSLFHFKSGFSKDFKEFKLWKYIVNESIYKELTDLNKQNTQIIGNGSSGSFFPSYRQTY
ncbi:MAG: peptidoglycan bridge formation glycyltransferase FemA/FemB family protein [Flavobacteriaceae bacterium]